MKTPFYLIMFKAFHAQRNNVKKHMHRFGLSIGQPKVLNYVSKHKDCMLKEIAAYCDVEPATASRLLNSLEENGMLEREIVSHNKRALRLSITEKGLEALTQWNEYCQHVENEELAGFSDEERKQFKQYLNRMYRNLSGKEIE
ncbi:MAG: MarR family transcriptional regulator [Erysipelotrichia bacterium]|nr:MarR family transcriptional regulator [Erysipelotrichia bacterium]